MWYIIKYKSSEEALLKEGLREKLGNEIKYYIPKIRYKKFFRNKFKITERKILDNYLICYHKEFSKKFILSELRYIRGLQYFLEGCNQNQKNINEFINFCKSFEDDEGYIKPDFFAQCSFKKGKFFSGPFINTIFDIISYQKNKLKVSFGKLTATINKNSKYYYSPV
tara:strand:- start:1410 stop:1910 length:501 start_codon:yes stop_codon:yes gene_type:complete